MDKKFLKKADVILILAIVIICGIFFISKQMSSTPVEAVIYKDGTEIERINLSSVKESYEYDLGCTPKAVLTVSKGSICYSYAECHDKLCVNTGKLTKVGDTAACLPSKTLIVLEGVKSSDAPDVIAY